MTRVQARAAGGPWRVVFDGQSLLNLPTTPVKATPPHKLMSGRQIPWHNAAINGYPWSFLLQDDEVRVHPQANLNDQSIIIMMGGQADITGYEGGFPPPTTGANLYTRVCTYANDARAAGFDYVICCTIPGSSIYDSTENTERLDFNTRLLADVNVAFDEKVNLEVAPLLWYQNSPYYLDNLHFSELGAQTWADLVAPHLENILTP